LVMAKFVTADLAESVIVNWLIVWPIVAILAVAILIIAELVIVE
jgi:hypothetical protein